MIHLPEPFSAERFTPGRFEAEHTLAMRGESIHLRTVAEDTVFYSPEGAPEASIFSISYERISDDPQRPVMFLWNGGPGSATSTLHLECFGPWGISRSENGDPCYGLVQSDDCILDVCDLVFVDPVGVGLSRLLDPAKADKYWSVDGDARSVAFMMIEWLRRRGRWQSPIYICGESYGTVRACRVLAELGRSPFSESRMVPGIPVAGVVLVGLATSDDLCDTELTIAMMPGMAATHWYHSPELHAIPQTDFVQEAWQFARQQLLPALFDGCAVSEDVKQCAAKKLSCYTGLAPDYWLSHDLKIASPRDFMGRALPGYTLDLYDARIKTPDGTPYNEIGSSNNVPLRVMNGLLLPRLGVSAERLYYTGNINIPIRFNQETEDLDPQHKRTHIQCLRDAMLSNPQMKLLFASGLYDLCTHAGNTRYVINHAALPMDRTTVREYPGGHGVYSSPEGREAFLRDIREMIEGG
ncbi:MAG: hypothetical protein ACI4O7_00365 [Aristaeellaceae bacterium]